MSSPAEGRRNPKKSAFSCDVCRKRKVKCDGRHPVCSLCKVRGDVCIYKLNPTLSYTQRLEQRVADLEAALADAKSAVSESPISYATTSQSATSDGFQKDRLTRIAEGSRTEGDAMVSFVESTSLFELPGSMRTHTVEQDQANEETAAMKESLVNSAWRERAYEKLADIPEPYRSLMDSHFCWIQPLFNFIYRPTFTRDMHTGGPYFSQALLNAVLAHSVRWCRGEPGMDLLLAPFENGAAFAKMAVEDLFKDIQYGNSKIPTVQALLLLSAQQCGSGNRTLAWLYSGMAFRLIEDMGFCVDGKRHADAGHLSTEDIEVRNRLFWSCYFWDKLISLYLGRSPAIQNSEISPPRILMDDTAEIEPWTPHGCLSSSYRPRQAHSISCFIQMCALAEILNQILIHFYNPTQELSASNIFQSAVAEGLKLRDWWRELPNHLKIDLADQELDCPPSHIVTLNCLYHTINILLNRAKLKLSREPKVASEMAEHNPLIHCISSACSIIALFVLYSRTFGEGHVVLSLAYSVYTAASIFLLELQATGNSAPNTLERLTFCVGVLERLRHTNPVISTGLNLIYKELEVLDIQTGLLFTSSSTAEAAGPQTSRSTIPLAMETHSASTFTNFNPHGALGQQLDPILLDSSYSNVQTEGVLSLDLLDMPPEMYDAFLQIEPISVTMHPGFDIF